MPGSQDTIGLSHAVAIGVGGMIGAGVFSMMGVAGNMAGGAAYLSFALAGILALLCAYSFGKLGARFTSAGGPVDYLFRGLGDHWFTGGLNVTLWLGYVLALAMYARAFSAYALTLLPEPLRTAWAQPALIIAIVFAFLGLNIAGARAVGRIEFLVVAAKVIVLIGFVAVALPMIETDRVAPSAWPSPLYIGFAAAVVFLSYEGFGLITNTAEDLANAPRDLPRALLISVAITIVIYVLAALSVIGNLTPARIQEAHEYALAEAVKPSFGEAGFKIMAVAALFSTASAINATLYGGANVSFTIAHYGALPPLFKRRIWQQARGGLFMTAVIVALLALALDLERIAMMGSAAFLVVYGAVNVAHLRLADETGANRLLVGTALTGCAAVLAVLVFYMASEQPRALAGLGVLMATGFGIDGAWRTYSNRLIATREDASNDS